MRHVGFLFRCLLCRKIEVLFRGVNLIILQATVDEHLLDVVRNQVKYIYENKKFCYFSLHCRSLTIYIALQKMVEFISLSRGSLKIGRD